MCLHQFSCFKWDCTVRQHHSSDPSAIKAEVCTLCIQELFTKHQCVIKPLCTATGSWGETELAKRNVKSACISLLKSEFFETWVANSSYSCPFWVLVTEQILLAFSLCTITSLLLNISSSLKISVHFIICNTVTYNIKWHRRSW